MIRINCTENIPYQTLRTLDEDAFLGLIRRGIHRMELHEADEWIKVDGVIKFNPHEGKNNGFY